MSTIHEKVHTELFNRINQVESDIGEIKGYLKGVVESNEKLIELLKKRDATQSRITWALVLLLFFAVGVIAFGAIGKEGLHSVRDTLPKMPTTAWAVPAHNDFDKWRYRA